jgi:hypothetical protein
MSIRVGASGLTFGYFHTQTLLTKHCFPSTLARCL